MEKSESITKLMTALVKAQSDIKVAKKDSSNPFFKSKYADLSAIIDAIKEPLNKHGLVFMQIVDMIGDATVVKTILAHESGEYIGGNVPVIPVKEKDKETGVLKEVTPQAMGSAITYAKRYGLQAIVGVPADEDDDGNAASGKGSAPKAEVKKAKPDFVF
jgi:hypothetical protein